MFFKHQRWPHHDFGSFPLNDTCRTCHLMRCHISVSDRCITQTNVSVHWGKVMFWCNYHLLLPVITSDLFWTIISWWASGSLVLLPVYCSPLQKNTIELRSQLLDFLLCRINWNCIFAGNYQYIFKSKNEKTQHKSRSWEKSKGIQCSRWKMRSSAWRDFHQVEKGFIDMWGQMDILQLVYPFRDAVYTLHFHNSGTVRMWKQAHLHWNN